MLIFLKVENSLIDVLKIMGNQMDYGLSGMRMDRRSKKELTKMVKRMD